MGRRINLSEFKEQRRAKGGFEIEAENGEVFTIDPPELWPDEAQALAAAGDNLGVAQLIIGGADVYAKFIAAGGTAALLGQIFTDNFGVDAGK